MATNQNKKTLYAIIFGVILFVLIFYVGFWLGQQKTKTKDVNNVVPKEVVKTTTPISITSKDITETNFTGTEPVISGSGLIAVKARAYVEATIADFRKQANIDVPDMRKKFGADSPTAQYEIDIDANYIKSAKTESIVMTVYTFTGGAHGSTIYNVITASKTSGKILSLSDVVKKENQVAFTDFVKKALNAWTPDGAGSAPVVFSDSVDALTFDSFTNWSFDENDKNLIIYFSQYDIGPGVLGEVPFPLPVEKIKNFLNI